MEPNNYPKDPIEGSKPPLDLEDDLDPYDDDDYDSFDEIERLGLY